MILFIFFIFFKFKFFYFKKKRSILMAQETGELLPDALLNFPPGYLEVY
jgi:hypothetical protein